MTRALEVWWEGRVVGRLTQDRHGALAFVYSDDWLRDEDAPSISASLPKRVEPYARRDCRPFFSGLLPEESQREAAARALGVSRANDFALLDGLGGDVAGALQLLPPGERPEELPLERSPLPLDEASGRWPGGLDERAPRRACHRPGRKSLPGCVGRGRRRRRLPAHFRAPWKARSLSG